MTNFWMKPIPVRQLHQAETELDRLRADNAAKDARIAELEAKLDALQRTYQFDVGRLVSERDQEKSRAERAEEGWHLANGTAELAMKHRDNAEGEIERLNNEEGL